MPKFSAMIHLWTRKCRNTKERIIHFSWRWKGSPDSWRDDTYAGPWKPFCCWGRGGYYKQHQVKYLGTMWLLDSTNVMSLISGRVLSRTQAFSLQVQSCYTLPSWMFPLSTKVKMIVFNLELAGCTVFVFVFVFSPELHD